MRPTIVLELVIVFIIGRMKCHLSIVVVASKIVAMINDKNLSILVGTANIVVAIVVIVVVVVVIIIYCKLSIVVVATSVLLVIIVTIMLNWNIPFLVITGLFFNIITIDLTVRDRPVTSNNM